jgi:hypothetical protein
VKGIDGNDGFNVIDLFFAEQAGLGELAAVSEAVTDRADLVYAGDNSVLGVCEQLKDESNSFIVSRHRVICLVGFFAGALVCDRAGQADLFAKSLCKHLTVLHVEELILQRAASGVDNQNFHVSDRSFPDVRALLGRASVILVIFAVFFARFVKIGKKQTILQ